MTNETAPAHHTAEVNGVRLHYVMAGTGDPVVLLQIRATQLQRTLVQRPAG